MVPDTLVHGEGLAVKFTENSLPDTLYLKKSNCSIRGDRFDFFGNGSCGLDQLTEDFWRCVF